MISFDDYQISWVAPIVPSVSLAGIPLGSSVEVLGRVLRKYQISTKELIYKFEGSPCLRLSVHGVDHCGNGGFSFILLDEACINDLLKGTPALSITVMKGKISAIKVYNFSFSGDLAESYIYKGRLPFGIGLGGVVSELLKFTSLQFDEAEGWFCAGLGCTGLEVTGWGVSLEERQDQIITAMCVISDGFS